MSVDLDEGKRLLAAAGGCRRLPATHHTGQVHGQAGVKLAAWLVNNAPALLAEIADARRDVEEMRAARPLLDKALRTITEWDGPFPHPFLKLAQPVIEYRAAIAASEPEGI